MLLTPLINHTASSEHQFENDQFRSFMENNSGFPELRYFRFEDREFWDPDARVFQYCCEKSPKLEEIHNVDSFSDQKLKENAFRLGWLTAYFTESPIQPRKSRNRMNRILAKVLSF